MNWFYVMPLVAIWVGFAITILDENHHKKLGSREKLVLQATFVVNGIKNNDICQFFHTIHAIIHHTVGSTDVTDAMYIDERYLSLQTETLSNTRSINMVLPYQFWSCSFERPEKWGHYLLQSEKIEVNAC